MLTLAVGLWSGQSTLDEGQTWSITKRLAGAYLVGGTLILIRRARSLTVGDHWFIRFGFALVLVVGTPVALKLWEHWHLVWQ